MNHRHPRLWTMASMRCSGIEAGAEAMVVVMREVDVVDVEDVGMGSVGSLGVGEAMDGDVVVGEDEGVVIELLVSDR